MGAKLATRPKSIQTKSDEEVILEIWDSRIKEIALKVVRDYGLDRDLAQDLAQEARLRVVLAARFGRPLVPAYVATVIKNAIRTALARERCPKGVELVPIPEDEEIAKGDLIPDSREGDPFIRAWMETLPPRLQVVYRLLFDQGCTQEEVGGCLGLSQTRISQLKQELVERAMLRLHRSP
jgi:RNA polymerase sigma factor (sigma-70 family)